MEVQLREIIDQIKREGVEAAEAEALVILNNAKAEAEKIVAEAKAEAEKIVSNARTENERIVRSGEDSIRQAGRNLLISFRESVAREVNNILTEKVSSVYSSDALAHLIVSAVEGWASKTDAESVTVILNDDDLKALEASIVYELKQKMLSGVTFKSGDTFEGGFRIAVNGDGAYYDYSAEAVVEMLSGYLTPKIKELLKEA